MMFGALLIEGAAGPQLVTEHPDLFWGVINSMYIGNILLLIMSIPMVGVFVKILGSDRASSPPSPCSSPCWACTP